MECPFVVGQRVVCIEGKANPNAWYPQTDGVYAVRSVFIWEDRAYLRLEEYTDTVRCSGPWGEGGWDASRFRPLVERSTETGMSMLRDLLNKTDKPVEVVA